MIKWHLEKRKISELKNWEKNPRTISEKAFKELEQSVDTLGNFEPLVINIDGTVIAGNQRLRLETKKGNNEVDVYVPERELSEEEIKKIGVISNRHSGEWDMDILANEFEDVLESLGFSDLLNKKEPYIEGEEEFTAELLEENNYLLLVFDNEVDWEFAKNVLDVKPVSSLDSKEGYERRGVGRVISGNKFINILSNK